MTPLTSYKLFSDVHPDEFVYLIDPKDHSIKECQVKRSMLHPKSNTKQVWLIEAYIPFNLDSIKVDLLKEAEKFGTTTTKQFLVHKDHYITMLFTKVPTVMATAKVYLEQWITRKESGLILPSRRA